MKPAMVPAAFVGHGSPINASAVTAMARPRTIQDFYGFPQQLFDVRYDAPGAPELVDEIAEMVKPVWIGPTRRRVNRGLIDSTTPFATR